MAMGEPAEYSVERSIKKSIESIQRLEKDDIHVIGCDISDEKNNTSKS